MIFSDDTLFGVIRYSSNRTLVLKSQYAVFFLAMQEIGGKPKEQNSKKQIQSQIPVTLLFRQFYFPIRH